MMPSLFVAHGSPMLAVEDNAYTHYLQTLAGTMDRPKAIVIFSAHWESDAQLVSEVDAYDTIYDFGGFPEALYRIQYPARGDLAVAEAIQDRLRKRGIGSVPESRRGLDHGAWVILRIMFPNADIPVVAMSVNAHLAPEDQYRIGQALTDLRADGILIIGSGGTVHNLRAARWTADSNDIDDFAVEFDDWLAVQLHAWNTKALFQFESLAPSARLAVPPYGREHFVPLLYAMGAADAGRQAECLHRSYELGNISLCVWRFT